MKNSFYQPLLLTVTTFAFLVTSVSAQDMLPYGAQVRDQSAFALGSMQWNVFFVQQNGSPAESWTGAELANLQTEIDQAATYWEGLTSGFHENAQLSINVNYQNGLTPTIVNSNPLANRREEWINDVMNPLGYNSNSRFSNVRNYNHDQRVNAGTHWTASIFIMDNVSTDQDRYAYAYHGGPYTILTHNAANWQPRNFSMVLAHEMGHIFFAHDEYAGSGRTRADRGGYLNVENGNAELDADRNNIGSDQVQSLMNNNGNFNTGVTYSPSSFSSDMFGHRDTDNDGVPDILDTTPDLFGTATEEDSVLGVFEFAGTVEVSPIQNLNPLSVNFSNSLSDMTINTIESAWYSLNGNEAVMFAAVDGDYGDYLENLNLSLTGLVGENTIDIFALNSVDNMSNVMSFSFTGINAVPEPAGTMAVLMFGIAAISRRKRNESQIAASR